MWTKTHLQAMEQIRRALQMFAGTLPEAQAREVAMVYPHWEPGKVYLKDQYITHGTDKNGDPLLYRVAQGHISSQEWPPADTTALYTCVSLTPGGYPVWAQPTGAQDAYNTGDVVYFEEDGKLYRSNIDGNTTVPGTDDRWWSVYEEV